MKTFEELLMTTLIEQLVRGYQFQDQSGYIRNELSPLQKMVDKYINDNYKEISIELSKKLDKSEYLNEAIKNKINEDFTSEYKRKDYEKYFLDGLKEKLEKEIVKDLSVLLDGKKITVEINY